MGFDFFHLIIPVSESDHIVLLETGKPYQIGDPVELPAVLLAHQFRVRAVPAPELRNDPLRYEQPDMLGADDDVKPVTDLGHIRDEREALPPGLEGLFHLLGDGRGHLNLVRAGEPPFGAHLDNSLVITPADAVAAVALFLVPDDLDTAPPLHRFIIQGCTDREVCTGAVDTDSVNGHRDRGLTGILVEMHGAH